MTTRIKLPSIFNSEGVLVPEFPFKDGDRYHETYLNTPAFETDHGICEVCSDVTDIEAQLKAFKVKRSRRNPETKQIEVVEIPLPYEIIGTNCGVTGWKHPLKK